MLDLSEREIAKKIIDKLPEYKITSLLLFLRGMEFDDEIEEIKKEIGMNI